MAVMYRVFNATSDCWARRHCMHVSLELLEISRSSSAFVLDTSCGCACTPDCVLVPRGQKDSAAAGRMLTKLRTQRAIRKPKVE